MSDTTESIAKGVTKGILEYTEEKIKQIVQQFKNGKIGFVQDPQTIKVAKEQKNTSEYTFFKKIRDRRKTLFTLPTRINTTKNKRKEQNTMEATT